MKNQYVRLFSMLFGFTFILSGVIFTFTKVYKDEKEREREAESAIVDEIGNIYQTFFNKTNEINDERNILLDDVADYISFYSNMYDDYDGMVEKFNNFETKLVELDDMSSYLKDNCKKAYSSSDANNKCYAYYINLEKSINLFIGDVKLFNSKIDEYNEWTEEANESEFNTKKYDKLEKYKPIKYNDYVDLNNDGTLLAKSDD